MVTAPLVPAIIIEIFVFWLMANKVFKAQAKTWKMILAVGIANIATSLLGTFIPLYKYVAENLIWVAIAFVLSVFIEWLIYIPFFRKTIKIRSLLGISLVANLITYIAIAYTQLR